MHNAGEGYLGRLAKWQPIAFLGRISLSTYAVQEVVIRYLGFAFFNCKDGYYETGAQQFPAWFIAVAFVTVIGAAYVVHELIEVRASAMLLGLLQRTFPTAGGSNSDAVTARKDNNQNESGSNSDATKTTHTKYNVKRFETSLTKSLLVDNNDNL